jgi:serine/threonine-protein kinase
VIPDRFGNRRRLREKGAVGVFSAHDEESGSAVIVKTFDPARAPQDPIGAMRFRREVLIASVLSHPAVVRCLGHGEDWIAFERLDGSLAASERCSRFQDPQRLGVLLCELAEALAYIHGRGIVHCDLKPAHVMFRADQAVLIDFGVAALVSGDPLAGAELAGSPAWMSPEQLDGLPARPCFDIWSLCAVGAWLLSDAPAITGTADDRLAARTNQSAPPFDLAGLRHHGSVLADLLIAGLGPMEHRPEAAEIAHRLRDQEIARSTAG